MNILHMFNGWLIGLNKKLMYKILVGASAVCWAIWLSRNYMVFNNSRAVTPLQVIFRGTHWIRYWTLWGAVCLKLQLWSFSLPMDGLLVIEFPMDNFVLVSQTESSFLVFGRTLSVIMNSYMHSFMQRLEY